MAAETIDLTGRQYHHANRTLCEQLFARSETACHQTVNTIVRLQPPIRKHVRFELDDFQHSALPPTVYSHNCMPESPARRLLPAGALLQTRVESVPSEIHNITSGKQEGTQS
jgi:hypothetical protein